MGYDSFAIEGRKYSEPGDVSVHRSCNHDGKHSISRNPMELPSTAASKKQIHNTDDGGKG